MLHSYASERRFAAPICYPARPRTLPFVLPAGHLRGLAALEAMQGFFLACASDLIRRRLDGGCREEPREIARIMLNVFQQQAVSW